MEESVFQQLLQKYKVIRSRDAYVPEPSRPRTPAARSSATAASATASSSLAGRPLPNAAPLAPAADFWAGLSAFLATRYTPAQARSIAAAFDEEHYA